MFVTARLVMQHHGHKFALCQYRRLVTAMPCHFEVSIESTIIAEGDVGSAGFEDGAKR